jgi:protein-tyrosine phosphatase
MERVRICFVCLGNICRSPTAEACFLDVIEREGVADRFEVDSAGTGAYHVGERAHPESRAAARAHGVEIRSVARQFTSADFDRFDYVVAMDGQNRANLLRMAEDERARAKVHLFRDFDPATPKGEDVPDPYYEGGFDAVFDICQAAARGLFDHLREARAL